MATTGTFYSNCTTIVPGSCYLYTDPGHSIPAPNGWYVFNNVCYRVYGPGGSTTGLVLSMSQCDPCPATTTTQCLIYGTLITMSDGSIKPIQDVVPGDKLLSLTDSESFYNNSKFELGESVVIELNKFEIEKVVDINNGELVSSLHHIHIVKNGDAGWNTMKADLLMIGDIMIDVNGEEFEITSLEIKDEPQTVYQISLDKRHLYFANEILTHNLKRGFICCTDDPNGVNCFQVNNTAHPTWSCVNWGYLGSCASC